MISMADVGLTQGMHCRVWLAIVGSRTTTEEISKRLGLVATKTLREGLATPLGAIATVNRWEFLIPIDRLEPLDNHLEVLEGLLTGDRAETLRQLSIEADVRVEVEIAHDNGIVISSNLVRLVADAGGSFDIDVRY